jgi:hypothetical protein
VHYTLPSSQKHHSTNITPSHQLYGTFRPPPPLHRFWGMYIRSGNPI